MIRIYVQNTIRQHTKYSQVIEGYAQKVQICLAVLVPPWNGILDVFRASTEVMLEFIL